MLATMETLTANFLPPILKLLIIITISLVGAFFGFRLLARISERLEKTPSYWDDTLARAAQPIVVIGFLFTGTCLIANVLIKHFEISMSNFNIGLTMDHIWQFSIILLPYLLLMRYLNLVLNRFEENNRGQTEFKQVSVELFIKIAQLCLSIATVLCLFQSAGISISGLLAFGGVGGLAVGLAAKDMLANVFGALTIHLDGPFKTGDKIHLKDKGIEGIVEHIGWRQTRIRGYDRTPVYVPNALFTNMAVINPSRMQNRRVDITLGLRYRDFERLDKVTEAIENYLAQHRELDHVRGSLARFVDFGDSSLNIRIRFFTLTTNWAQYMRVRHEILIKIGRIIQQLGAEFAFPTCTINLSAEDVTALLSTQPTQIEAEQQSRR